VKEMEYLMAKKPEEFTGEEMRNTLDKIIADGGDFPASEKTNCFGNQVSRPIRSIISKIYVK